MRHRSLFLTLLLFVVVEPDSVRAESGLASFYGGAGKRGEMTCAHRTRPFGSFVTV
jgi:rare lipoprotein A